MLPSVETIESLIEGREGRACEAHYAANKVARLRQFFAIERADYNAILQAAEEQVVEVTIRIRHQALVVPVSDAISQQITKELWEVQGRRLHSLEVEILSALRELYQEQKDNGSTSLRAQTFALCMPPAETAPVSALAQGQASPTPQHRRAARPRRETEAA